VYKYLPVVTVADAFVARGGNVTAVSGASPDKPADPNEVAEAIVAAAAADYVILVVGDSGCPHVHRCTCGEDADRTSLLPAGGQLELLEAVLANPDVLSKTILVHIGGRPMSFPDNSAAAVLLPSIVTAMVPGEEGGNGIVDVLTGDTAPSGRLTVTWTRSSGYIGTSVQPYWQFSQVRLRLLLTIHLPPFGVYLYSDNWWWSLQVNNAPWMDGPATALFPFGHGIGYTTFSFSETTSTNTSASATADDSVTVTTTVENTGSVPSAVPVQAYCTFLDTPTMAVRVLRFRKMLCGFTKVMAQPGEALNVSIEVSIRDLARWDPDATSPTVPNPEFGVGYSGAYVIDQGRYEVAVGDCSGAASAINLADAFKCNQSTSIFSVERTITF
jgi:beta-glucosidase